jgi:3-deoxy-D-manno-octulosonic acid kinase
VSAAAPALERTLRGDATVIAPRALMRPLAEVRLDRPWEFVAAPPPGPGTGRGPRGLATLPGVGRVLVKRYLRGGALARVNPERYFGTGRFEREIATGCVARAAGLPVAETLAVVVRPASPGWHAWGIARFVEDAPDLALWLAGRASDPPLDGALWRAALAVVGRLHEGGLEHRDLNLGNLVARRAADDVWDVVAVDLDRARWWGRPVPERVRERALQRLERSFRKLFPGRALPDGR